MNQNENAATNVKEEVRISIGTKVEFPETMKTQLTTTAKLSELVGEFFLPIFPDYDGAYINLVNGQFQLCLYFRDKIDDSHLAEGQYKAVRNVISAKTDRSCPMIDRIRNMNDINGSRNITLTEELKSALEPFMIKHNNAQVNWGQVISEVTEPGYNNSQYIYLKIMGLDIYKILREIYGNKIKVNGADHPVDYEIQPIRPIGQAVGNDLNYLISIMQLDNVEVADLCNSVGIIPVQGRIYKVMPKL